MQYPDRTNKGRGGAKNSLICSYLRVLYIARFQAGKVKRVSGVQSTRPAKGSKAGAKFQNKTREAGLSGTINNKSGGGGRQPKRQGQGSPQKNPGTKSAKPFWDSRMFWFRKNFQKKFRENEKGLCI